MKRFHSGSPRNGGMTLVEVLMALMIMSIGVSAVAVLFPISTLRSVRAAQQTNGGIVAYNVRELINIHPELIFDPDNDGDLEEHFRAVAQRNYIVDPIGFHTLNLDVRDGTVQLTGGANPAPFYGNTGVAPSSIPRFGGPLTLRNGQKSLTAKDAVTRFQAFRLEAQQFASQGDGWTTLIDAEPTAWLNGQVTLPEQVDLSDVPTPQSMIPNDGAAYFTTPDMLRVVLFNETSRFSQSFPLTGISGNVIYYSEDLNGNQSLDALEDVNMNGTLDARILPYEFNNGTSYQVSRVLIQSRKLSDYTWMLNVRRRSDGIARSVDVVVRFGDGVQLEDERGFDATFVAGTTSVYVNNAADVEASLRRGRHIFDAVNGVWYRIQQVSEHTDFDYHVVVQQTIEENAGAGTLDANGNPNPTGPFGTAVIPTGIVDVYPLGSFQLPDSLKNSTF